MPESRNKRGEIHLGDLIHALSNLPWQDDGQAVAIARSLGFKLQLEAHGAPVKQIYNPHRYTAGKRAVQPPSKHRPFFPTPPQPSVEIKLPSNMLESRLKQLSERMPPEGPRPGWLDKDFQLLEKENETHRQLHRQSLFHDNTSRGILSAAIATQRDGGEIDLHRLIERTVRCEILSEIPTLPRATLERGCQLLLDYSDNMVPFWEDLNALADQLEAILGENDLLVFEFDSDPNTAMRWTPSDKMASWSPQQGHPILAATDLGIQGRKRAPIVTPAWRSFIQRCETAGCPLLILLPWARTYWPQDLGHHPILLHWHPRTSASLIRQRIGIGHEVDE